MERITSRKNSFIQEIRNYEGEALLCVGAKMLEEAVKAGAEIEAVLWKETPGEADCARQYVAPAELFDYACPQKNSPGPLFLAVPKAAEKKAIRNAIVLENVQDPGNVGTVIRTANAFDIDCVYLVGDCASLHNPKTVRASMGAVFYQKVLVDELPELPIYGASLSHNSVNINELTLKDCAVAIGSEGHGLSAEMLGKCAGTLIIPMSERAESLNAAVAAAIVMWQMKAALA